MPVSNCFRTEWMDILDPLTTPLRDSPTRCWVMAPCLYHCLITGLFIFSIHGLLSIENGLFWTLGSHLPSLWECNTVCIFNRIRYHTMVKWFLRCLDPTQNTSSSRMRNCAVFSSVLSVAAQYIFTGLR